MSRYAVKIGEIHLKANKPITDKQRKRALELLTATCGTYMITVDDVEIALSVDGNNLEATHPKVR